MRIHHFFIAAALVATTASADARPHRVVIGDFYGQAKLAHAGRAIAVTSVSDHCDIVSAKQWSAAMSAAKGHGAERWSSAATDTGVDAVIEGWISADGVRTPTMTIEVRDASTGRQIDTVTVRIGNDGNLDERSTHKLATELVELVEWAGSHEMIAPAFLN
ncbi:MAG TPA: hypothetical protein VGL61_16340 [Kofleriaceae bacterium]|jgi:hypothetical protein